MKIKFPRPVYIIDAKRTAIARPHRGLKSWSAAGLAACVLRGMVFVPPVDEVIFGNAVPAGTGQNFIREAVLMAGLSVGTPAYTVSNVCGSGLQSVILGARTILSGQAHCVIAGASESATNNPLLVWQEGEKPVSSLLRDGLTCSLAQITMGVICERLATKKNISRQAQDRYALLSHQKACRAIERGVFAKEIVPVPFDGGMPFERDEYPRSKASMERFAEMPAAFLDGGTLSAGNVSTPADGACAVVLASEDFIERNKLAPLGFIEAYASIGIPGNEVFSEGVEAIKNCMSAWGLTVSGVDLFEITEAFAAQAYFTQKELNIPDAKMNVYGGDIALGHPLGMAGIRSLVTLVHALKRQNKKKGIVYTAFGSGGAIAVAMESL